MAVIQTLQEILNDHEEGIILVPFDDKYVLMDPDMLCDYLLGGKSEATYYVKDNVLHMNIKDAKDSYTA